MAIQHKGSGEVIFLIDKSIAFKWFVIFLAQKYFLQQLRGYLVLVRWTAGQVEDS